jgi:hypothetical protein
VLDGEKVLGKKTTFTFDRNIDDIAARRSPQQMRALVRGPAARRTRDPACRSVREWRSRRAALRPA